MKRASLLLAAAIVVVANAFALVHAWRNRSGPIQTLRVQHDMACQYVVD